MPLVRKKRLPDPKLRHTRIRRVVARELKPVANAAEASRARIVANFSDASRPTFKATITVKPNRFEIVTVVRRGQRLPGSDATTGDLWKWLDKTGTRPHVIRPRKEGGTLAFPWGGPGSYQSKTGARPARFGGPGTVQNARPTFRKQVNHPGFEPRNFSKVIDKDLRRDFDRAVRQAYRKAARAA